MKEEMPPLPVRRVLHVLAVSLPHLNGYTVRSRYIVETQRALFDARPLVVTSPFYAGNPAAVEEAVFAGIPHLRVAHPVDARADLGAGDRLVAALYRARHSPRLRRLLTGIRSRGAIHEPAEGGGGAPRRRLRARAERRIVQAVRVPIDGCLLCLEQVEERLLLRRFERALRHLVEDREIELIHAHSPFRAGLPAIRAARALGRPAVYEVRGLWEESAVASGYLAAGDGAYRRWREGETATMRAADAVICISEELRREVVRRGVDAGRVFVVPNAAEPADLAPAEPSPGDSLADSLRLRLAPTTLGYVGSVRALEGVDELVRAFAEVVRRGHDVSLLVVGGGEVETLQSLARDLGVDGRAFFTGPVPHRDVGRLYDLIDVFAVTRPDTVVTRLVTPLKPFEAMARGKALVISDLPALREIVQEEVTGLVYRAGDVSGLADRCIRLIAEPRLRRELGDRARAWVHAERTWAGVLAELPRIYATACENAARRASGHSGARLP